MILTCQSILEATSVNSLEEDGESPIPVSLQRLHEVSHRQREHHSVYCVRYALKYVEMVT